MNIWLQPKDRHASDCSAPLVCIEQEVLEGELAVTRVSKNHQLFLLGKKYLIVLSNKL